MSENISYKHFQPYNLWTVDESDEAATLYEEVYDETCGIYIKCNERPADIIDSGTGDRYLNEDLGVIRLKCFLLTIGTPIVHAVAAIVTMALDLVKLISFYHFWKPLQDNHIESDSDYDLTERLFDVKTDVLQFLLAPVSILLLELSALYGMIMPLDGRKLYASFERLTYGDAVLAPCFQPEADEHFFGGDIRRANAW